MDPNTLPFTYHLEHFDLALGIRVASALDTELEPFLYDPVMVEPVLRLGTAFQLAERFAIAGQIEGSVFESEAGARSLDTSLSLKRVTLGIEGRYHFHHRVFAYARLAPGLEFGKAELSADLGSELGLMDNSTAFHLDASGGLALRLAGSNKGTVRSVRFWMFLEGGYRMATKHKFDLQNEDGPSRSTGLELPGLHASGGFGTGGLMLTF